MVVPAMQLASKIPDMSVQLWSSALLRGESEQGCQACLKGPGSIQAGVSPGGFYFCLFIYWKQGLAGLEFWVDKAGLEVTDLHSFVCQVTAPSFQGDFKNCDRWGLRSCCRAWWVIPESQMGLDL